MRTIIVDDELWSVEQFKIECENITDISLLGYFDNPYKAIEFAKENYVELALLDIEMPGMNGIDHAARSPTPWAAMSTPTAISRWTIWPVAAGVSAI